MSVDRQDHDDSSHLEESVVDREVIAALTEQVLIDRAEIENLRLALESSRRIGAAIGIVMATYKVTEETAFTVLRTKSQRTNRKLHDVADDVIFTGVVEA